MTLEETLKSVKEAFVGKSAEAEAKASEVNALSAKDIRAAKTLRGFFQSPGGQELLKKFSELGIL